MNKSYEILKRDALLVNSRVKLDEILGKHIIITGASGLIGINLIASIKEFCEDKKESRYPRVTAVIHNDIPQLFKANIEAKCIEIKKGDLTDSAFADSLDNADYIIHAAGYGQPGKFMQDKIRTIAINTSATMYLLKKLKPHGKFLFLSTSEVYSGLKNPPYKESQIGTTNTIHPRACYIEGKRCGESICHAYYEIGRNVKSARLSLAYGPGTRAGDMRVLNSFIEKGLAGRIEMMDKGEARRTYCYISDAIELMWSIMLFGKKPIYNVGGYSTTSIVDLANKIGDILDVKVITPKKINTMSGAPDEVRLDMRESAKDFKKNKEDFVILDDGLKNTIEWQKELYKL